MRSRHVDVPSKLIALAAVGLTALVACAGSPSNERVATSASIASASASASAAPSPEPMTTGGVLGLDDDEPTPTPTPVPTVSDGAGPEPAPTDSPAGVDAVVRRISDAQWARMVRTGTWRPGCPVGRADLRRLTVSYMDFTGTLQRGVLVANRDVVDDLIAVFAELLDAGFPIARMRPVEHYGGDVDASLKANNTSAFNCRKPGQINAPQKESPHANGRAIDINPVQNPWRDPRCTCWSPSKEYAKGAFGPGIIRADTLPVQLFRARGWIWQNIKVPDYMHFDTGYPSRPRDG